MATPRRRDRKPGEKPGADAAWRPSPGPLALAVAVVVGSALWFGHETLFSSPPPAAADDAATRTKLAQASRDSAAAPVPAAVTATVAASTVAPQPAAAPSATAADERPRIRRQRDPDGDQTPDLADYVNEGELPTMAEVIERLHRAGVHSGLGAFPPPGTKPPLVGLAVPEDYALPEGYVRHHQATDDGQRIEPILMYSPDHRFVDAAGRPVAIPEDRVVPPELAPPGLPLRRIAIPAPAEPGRPGR